MNAKDVLRDFGLTRKEADVYVFLAKYEISTGGEIAKHTKIARSLVYRILKNLQAKGLVETTLDSPIRFVAVPFEKALDLIIKTKQEEVLLIEKTRRDLIENWRTTSEIRPKSETEKFMIIEGNKNIYPRISQMMKEAKQSFYGILPIPSLVRAEQFGVFDSVFKHPAKSTTNFWIITEITNEELKATKLLKPKLDKEIYLKARKLSSSFTPLPRVAIRDEKEIVFFTRPSSDISRKKKDEVCIYTNCESLIQTYTNIFQEMWENSTDLEDMLTEIEFGDYLTESPVKSQSNYTELDEVSEKDKSFHRISEQERKKLGEYLHQIKLLKEEERDILDCASVIGQNFSLETIEKVTNLNRFRLLKELNSIRRKYKLINFTDNVFHFSHSKIREILYKEIEPPLRKEYHTIIAKTLEDLNKDRIVEINDRLAYHYYNADNARKAVPLLLKAGLSAWKEYKIFEAIDHYFKALELMQKDEVWKEKETGVLEDLGDLYALSAQYDVADAFYEKVLENTKNDELTDKVERKLRNEKIIDKDGKKITYPIYGEGNQTVLFIGAIFYFMPQILHFCQKHRVAAMDLLEPQIQAKVPIEHTYELYLKILEAIIEDLNNQKLYLIGAGLGGLLAISYVAEHPDKVGKLGLFATSVLRKTHTGLEQKRIENFWAMSFQNPTWGAKKMRTSLMKTFTKKGITDALDAFHQMPKYSPEMAVINYKIEMDADVRPLLSKIKVPTLIIEGQDTFRPKENLECFRRIPNSKVHLLKDATLITKDKDKLNALLESFFADDKI